MSDAILVATFRAARSIVPAPLRDQTERIYNLFLRALPLKSRIAVQFYKSFRFFPNFNSPRTFSEKIQTLKLRNPSYLSICTNKVTAKDYCAERIGREHIIPTLYHGIELPPIEQRNWPLPFVIKANHGSGLNMFIRDKSDIDWPAIEVTLKTWLSYKFGEVSGELYYTSFKPEILVEPFIARSSDLPLDYKVFVFGGKVHCIQVDTDREFAHKRVFFDANWNRLPFRYNHYPTEQRHIERPRCLEQMCLAAEVIGHDLDFVRVDFYDIDGKMYFGEMGFTPEAGYARFDPPEMDLVFGNLWPAAA